MISQEMKKKRARERETNYIFMKGPKKLFDDTHNHVADSADEKADGLSDKNGQQADDEKNGKTTWKLIFV